MDFDLKSGFFRFLIVSLVVVVGRFQRKSLFLAVGS